MSSCAAGAAPFFRKPFMVSVKLSPTGAVCGTITPPAGESNSGQRIFYRMCARGFGSAPDGVAGQLANCGLDVALGHRGDGMRGIDAGCRRQRAAVQHVESRVAEDL